jgi:YD repeat-containing protein
MATQCGARCRRSAPAGTQSTATYNSLGQLAQATDPTGSMQRARRRQIDL